MPVSGVANGDIRKWITVAYDAHTRFQITATLNDQTWKWDAKIAGASSGTLVEPPADIDLTARKPNRCLSKATEWLLGAIDRDEISVTG